MYKIASRYFFYTLGLISLRNALEKKQNTLQVPSFRGVVEVKHKLPGRIRFCLPKLKGNEEGFNELKSQLEKINPIKNIETNPITSSLLIEHTEEIEPTLIVGIIIRLLGMEEQVKNKPQSFITREFKGAQEGVSLAIDEKTNGFLDLRSLMFLLFTTTGIRKIIKNPEIAPTGFTYLWWGYSMIKI